MSKVVSIITPSFNRAAIVHETAVSIFNQIYSFWEWVIVDDGSTDDSWNVLQKFSEKDNRVKIFKRDREPKGACTCRNIAIEKSTGDYLVFLDTDDLLASFCLQQRVEAMEKNPDCDFVIFPMLLFKDKPDDLKMLWSIDNGKDDLLRILEGDPICQGTGTLWKKSSFQEIGMWREDLKLWQDIELHIRGLLWPMKYVSRMDLQPDVFLRISDVSLSRTGYHSLPKLESRINVFYYACQTIQEKKITDRYRDGLRYMGWNIAVSAINSMQFEKAKEVLQYCSQQKIFSREEIRQLKNYLFIRKFKVYKIKRLNDFYFNKVNAITTEPIATVGKISWGKPVLV